MAGLSRKLNLSEQDINLKEALQKLYAPGIQNDIELFSLSSQVSSFISSGTELQEDPSAQIIALSSQVFKTKVSGVDKVIKRTKFITKDYTFATGNQVYFDTYTLGSGNSSDVSAPILSSNGSIAKVNMSNPGDGYFFKKVNALGAVENLTADITVSGVVLEGEKSGANNAIATIKFEIDPTIYATANVDTYSINKVNYNAGDPANNLYGTGHDFQMNANGTWTYTADSSSSRLSTNVVVVVTFENSVVKEYTLVSTQQSNSDQSGSLLLPPTNAPKELSDYTGFYTRRFKISSIELTSRGSGYILGERLKVLEGAVVNTTGSAALYLEKQQDYLYSGNKPSIFVINYLYDVKNAGPDGFYLYDTNKESYIFLDLEKDKTQLNNDILAKEIKIARFDGLNIKDIFNLRFSSSNVALDSYVNRYSISGLIVQDINNLQEEATLIALDSQKAIQNTRLPISTADARNDLGFEFNKFTGASAIFRQRLIIRDQDFLLNPTNTWITKESLSTAFSSGRNFEIVHDDDKKRVPGLFIKTGETYQRAFSTNDKPFITIENSSITNPDLSGGSYTVSAQDKDSNGTYSFNTEVAILSQRIQPVSLGTLNSESHYLGTDGALYFHKESAPEVSTVAREAQDSSGNINTYLVPLFRYLP